MNREESNRYNGMLTRHAARLGLNCKVLKGYVAEMPDGKKVDLGRTQRQARTALYKMLHPDVKAARLGSHGDLRPADLRRDKKVTS